MDLNGDIYRPQSEVWTVTYFADNGEVFRRFNVKFYEMQEALMDLSREAYENGTHAARIEMT